MMDRSYSPEPSELYEGLSKESRDILKRIALLAIEHSHDERINRLIGDAVGIRTFTSDVDMSRTLNQEISETRDVNKALLKAIRAPREAVNIQVIHKLIDQGADVNYRMIDSRTPIFIAAEKWFSDDIIELARLGADVNALDEAGRPAIFYAVDSNNYSSVHSLLEVGASTSYRDANGETLLHHARDFLVIQTLIEHGMDPNIKSLAKNSRTPIFNISVNTVDAGDLRQLIESGANVNAKDAEDGSTPLHWIAKSYSGLNEIEELLDAGADPNAVTTSELSTPLHWLAGSDDPDASKAKLLVDRGARCNALDAHRRTPADIFLMTFNPEDRPIFFDFIKQLDVGGA